MRRREFIQKSLLGLGTFLLYSSPGNSRPKAVTEGKRRAKSLIFLTMAGGPSQMDTFDYRPELSRMKNKTVTGFTSEKGLDGGVILDSFWKFKQYGQSGAWVSDLFPFQAQTVDDLAFIKSCTCTSNNHSLALYEMNTGHVTAGHPFLGAWINYALGNRNPLLPGSVVMVDPRGYPRNGELNWTAGALDQGHQILEVNSLDSPVSHMDLPAGVSVSSQEKYVRSLMELNRIHSRDRPHFPEFQKRSRQFAEAHLMAPPLKAMFDLSGESEATQKLYGLDRPHSRTFGKQLLWARRMVERGIPFIQIYSGGGALDEMTWDHHKNMELHQNLAASVDWPIKGLIQDLKARGLLEETLLLWGGEFGRLPVVDLNSLSGRDHNHEAFTMWLAGAGIKKGVSFGQTDELGLRAVENPVSVGDIHATLLHLMGIDHKALSYNDKGVLLRLTKESDKIIGPVIDRA